MKKILSLLLMFIMLCLLAACGSSGESSDNGKIHAKLILLPQNESEVEHDIEVTANSNLRDALLEAGLITEESYSELFITTIDGYSADWQAEENPRTWQVLDADKEVINGFFEEITVEDGKTYYIEDIEVPNFDD